MAYLTRIYRHWRNLDRLQATQDQLAICRALLAATMRERDEIAALCDQAQRNLAAERQWRKIVRQHLRTWITRCVESNVSLN